MGLVRARYQSCVGSAWVFLLYYRWVLTDVHSTVLPPFASRPISHLCPSQLWITWTCQKFSTCSVQSTPPSHLQEERGIHQGRRWQDSFHSLGWHRAWLCLSAHGPSPATTLRGGHPLNASAIPGSGKEDAFPWAWWEVRGRGQRGRVKPYVPVNMVPPEAATWAGRSREVLRQQGLSLLPSASIFDLQIFRSGHPPIRSNMTLPHMLRASSLPSQDMARTKASGSSGWVGGDGSACLALALSAQIHILSLARTPTQKHHYSFHHTHSWGWGRPWQVGQPGRWGWGTLVFSPPHKQDRYVPSEHAGGDYFNKHFCTRKSVCLT